MLEHGRTQRDVAWEFGVSQNCISNVCQRYQQTDSFRRRPGSGRRRATNAADDRYLSLLARRNPFQSTRVLEGQFRHATANHLSDQSVRNRLHANNLASRRPVVVTRMTAAHRRARVAFARHQSRWTFNQWSHVLFTNESRFSVDQPDGRIRVWINVGQRHTPQFRVEHNRWGGGSVMVWGGISSTHITVLHIVQGNMNAMNYRDDVVQPIVLPMANIMGRGFIRMDDNARPHRARIVKGSVT